MRRRSDAYLNATQILKVAGFDKPQRTRVLEREVQKGEHEKVQGGYGKYQGECGATIWWFGRLAGFCLVTSAFLVKAVECCRVTIRRDALVGRCELQPA